MKMHTCVDDKVCLTFDTTFVPRAPNTSHDLKWIRARSPVRRALRAFSWCEDEVDGPQVVGRDGMIMAGFVVRMTKVWIAEELAQNRGALKMIMNHERDVLAAAEDGGGEYLEELGLALEQRIRPPVKLTVQIVHDIVQQEMPRLGECVRNCARAFDRRDLPDLRRALRRVGVPPDL